VFTARYGLNIFMFMECVLVSLDDGVRDEFRKILK
jgi:hypothetical protein